MEVLLQSFHLTKTMAQTFVNNKSPSSPLFQHREPSGTQTLGHRGSKNRFLSRRRSRSSDPVQHQLVHPDGARSGLNLNMISGDTSPGSLQDSPSSSGSVSGSRPQSPPSPAVQDAGNGGMKVGSPRIHCHNHRVSMIAMEQSGTRSGSSSPCLGSPVHGRRFPGSHCSRRADYSSYTRLGCCFI